MEKKNAFKKVKQIFTYKSHILLLLLIQTFYGQPIQLTSRQSKSVRQKKVVAEEDGRSEGIIYYQTVEWKEEGL